MSEDHDYLTLMEKLNKTQLQILEVFKELKKPLIYADIYQYFANIDIKIGDSTIRENIIDLHKKNFIIHHHQNDDTIIKQKRKHVKKQNPYDMKKLGRPNKYFSLNHEIMELI